jgi:predicted ribosome quality control (RQC) complex YloA/Tae2 family protein
VSESLEGIESDRARVDTADLKELLRLAERFSAGENQPRGRARDNLSREKRKPIDRWSRRFEAGDGTEIRVGKGAAENDRLTFSAARGDDIWLHASGTSGAHVLLRLAKGNKPSPEALADAALLAAHYSGAKSETKVEVVYTEARHVKKTKGDPPGRVSVARGRTLLVTVDEARLARLFGRTTP